MGHEKLLERILQGDEEPKDLPLPLLQSITNDFSEERKIGQGGFGEVYKGVLRSGSIVAVKRIYVNEHTIDDKLFHREFNSLSRINHQNIVRFLGFCSNTHQTSIKEAGSEETNLANVRERLLCFEYISNGSLDKYITDELRGLEWETRYEIITGICEGMRYLHEEKEIVHMDLKPANILLDDTYMVPKITDFGLSRSHKSTHTMAQPIGTRGYIAPEYERERKTSAKSDIYSLGAIIFELVTGCMRDPDKNNVLRRWRHRWNKPPTLLQYQQVTRCIEIAVSCRQNEPKDRPLIGDIINFLRKFESTDGYTGQESTYLDDDMLGIEPLKLKFDEMSWSVNLTNKTKACFAFSIERPSKHYTIDPDKGIVRPGCSEFLVQIAVMTPQVTQNADKLIVWSTKVDEGRRVEDIREDIFYEAADEVDLMVVYEPVEAVSPKLKAINYSSYEDNKREQLDRRNFHPPGNFSHSEPANMTYLVRVSDRTMDVTRGAMGSLLHKLGVLHKHEFNLETSVKKDIDSLSKDLREMQAVLHKVSEVPHENLIDMVRHWASNVREMSYDLEDFVDGFLVHSEPDSNTSGFKELTHELCFLLDKGKSHHTVSDLIKEKRTQVEGAAKECKIFKFDSVVPNAAAKAAIDDLRSLVIHKHKTELVGIESPRDDIIRIFGEGVDGSEQNLKIVSIVGLGGLGKTTLAKAVYDKMKAQFNPKIFVSVGQNPSVKKVLENIIRKIEKQFKIKKQFNAENLHVGDLIEKLQELLEDKRYFLVIDDIWEFETWGHIQLAFLDTECGSRVITTTRKHDVALATCSVIGEYVYRIKPLSDEDSRTLFFRRTFGPKKGCPDTPRKEAISIDILKKCGGMPLAINSIASLLSCKTDSTWEYVWKSLGAMTEGDDLEKMKQILDLSYIHLSAHLKTCLLYVCMYPEDREISKNDLLRQWVAEGFVHVSRNCLDAEDVAENYFQDLINMCMIQPGEIDAYSNEVLSCRVHDIILDLMRSKSSKENFIHVVDGPKDDTREIRRVSICNDTEDDIRISKTKIKGSLLHVRSILFYRRLHVPLSTSYSWLNLYYCLQPKFIRVLHIEHGFSDVDLTVISRLFLLRYLKVSGGGHGLKLPNQIGKLQQLETIDLNSVKLENFPSDIVSLPLLSHLLLGDVDGVQLPDRIDRLKSLRTLGGVDVIGSSLENIMGLGKLTNLRELKIFQSRWPLVPRVAAVHMDVLHSSIRMLSDSLRILSFSGGLGRSVDAPASWSSSSLFRQVCHIRELDLSRCNFQRCPKWIDQLHGLYKFRIGVREVADVVSIVACLPLLAYFDLAICVIQKGQEESVVIPGGRAFQALKHLSFHCPNASLTFKAGAMPNLEKLEIEFRYDRTPVGIQHLRAPTLKDISLTGSGFQVDWGSNLALHHFSKEKVDEYVQRRTSMEHQLKEAFKLHHPDAKVVVLLF